jgi:hypothetical protein
MIQVFRDRVARGAQPMAFARVQFRAERLRGNDRKSQWIFVFAVSTSFSAGTGPPRCEAVAHYRAATIQ